MFDEIADELCDREQEFFEAVRRYRHSNNIEARRAIHVAQQRLEQAKAKAHLLLFS